MSVRIDKCLLLVLHINIATLSSISPSSKGLRSETTTVAQSGAVNLSVDQIAIPELKNECSDSINAAVQAKLSESSGNDPNSILEWIDASLELFSEGPINVNPLKNEFADRVRSAVQVALSESSDKDPDDILKWIDSSIGLFSEGQMDENLLAAYARLCKDSSDNIGEMRSLTNEIGIGVTAFRDNMGASAARVALALAMLDKAREVYALGVLQEDSPSQDYHSRNTDSHLDNRIGYFQIYDNEHDQLNFKISEYCGTVDGFEHLNDLSDIIHEMKKLVELIPHDQGFLNYITNEFLLEDLADDGGGSAKSREQAAQIVRRIFNTYGDDHGTPFGVVPTMSMLRDDPPASLLALYALIDYLETPTPIKMIKVEDTAHLVECLVKEPIYIFPPYANLDTNTYVSIREASACQQYYPHPPYTDCENELGPLRIYNHPLGRDIIRRRSRTIYDEDEECFVEIGGFTYSYLFPYPSRSKVLISDTLLPLFSLVHALALIEGKVPIPENDDQDLIVDLVHGFMFTAENLTTVVQDEEGSGSDHRLLSPVEAHIKSIKAKIIEAIVRDG